MNFLPSKCKIHDVDVYNICIDSHDCPDRRLCALCLGGSHKHIDKRNTPLLQEVWNQLSQKTNTYTTFNKPYEKIYISLKDKIMTTLINLQRSLQDMLELIELSDQGIKNLIERVQQPQEISCFTNNEINLMISIIQTNILEEKQAFKKQYGYDNIDKLFVMLEKTEKYMDSLNQFAFSIIQNKPYQNQVKLEGPIILGMKNGIYNYVYPDQSIEPAGFYEFDNKHGLWRKDRSFIEGSKFTKKFEFEEYVLGKRTKTIKQEYKMFDYKGRKKGQWLIFEGVNKQLQLTGIYEDDVQINQWSYLFRGQICGGGSYLQGRKSGPWIEPHEKYDEEYKQIFKSHCAQHIGEYLEGSKIGEWRIEDKGCKIGGGFYQNGLKQGKWVELCDIYGINQTITLVGEYCSGTKIGQWVICFGVVQIGGGQFDNHGQQQDNWIELYDSFGQQSKALFQGTYKSGRRIGEWKIIVNKYRIGGGFYDNNGLRIGQWIELHQLYGISSNATNEGKYKDGQRVGQWIIREKGKTIGGGQYDEYGQKHGFWTELHKYYRYQFVHLTEKGNYFNGKRVDEWKIYDEENAVGGGFYNEEGQQIGQWTEINEGYSDHLKIIQNGEFQNGELQGEWTKKIN